MKSLLPLALLVTFLFQSPVAAQSPHPTTKIGFHLLKEMEPDKNAVVSPMSLHLAFAMAADGAKGPTQTEMLTSLGLGADYLNVCKADMEALRGDGAEVAIANRLWPLLSLKLKDKFLTNCRQVFQAEPKALDFGQTENARKTINSWVSEITKGHIPELLKKGELDGGTRLALTNALYFKGSWSDPFQPQQTKSGSFHAPEGVVQVMMMSQAKRHGYFENNVLQAVRLNYADSALSMTLLVPKKVDGWKALRQSFDPAVLRKLDEAADLRGEERTVNLEMPRFKVRANLNVIRAMGSLGMKLCFGDSADFSNMTAEPGICIGAAVHEAMVEVDEAGTVGAAATAIIMSRSMAHADARVIVDRPFLFLISDQAGRALFVGQVVKPELATEG